MKNQTLEFSDQKGHGPTSTLKQKKKKIKRLAHKLENVLKFSSRKTYRAFLCHEDQTQSSLLAFS